MGNGRDLIFICTECGSPAVSVPASLAASDYVRCGGCGRPLMPWGAFKARIEAETAPCHAPARRRAASTVPAR